MPRYNVEHKGKWACFSTISDDFITPFMRIKRYERWRKKQYGKTGYVPLPETNLMTYEEAMEIIKLREQEENNHEFE